MAATTICVGQLKYHFAYLAGLQICSDGGEQYPLQKKMEKFLHCDKSLLVGEEGGEWINIICSIMAQL